MGALMQVSKATVMPEFLVGHIQPAYLHYGIVAGKSRQRIPYPFFRISAIAAAVEVTPGYISKVMRGKQAPSMQVAVRLAKVLDITVEELRQELTRLA